MGGWKNFCLVGEKKKGRMENVVYTLYKLTIMSLLYNI